jgi:sugar transferase (PEP-CTERM/EpsH1 system associated)
MSCPQTYGANNLANIVIVAQRVPYPPNKGEKLRTFHQIEFLRSEGHDITVLCPIENKNDDQLAVELSKHLHISVFTFQLPNKIIRLARAIVGGKSFSESNFYCNGLAQKLEKLGRVADLVICSASSLSPYVFNMKDNKNAFLLMDLMDVDSDKWRQYAQSANWPMTMIYNREKRLVARLEKAVVEHFDASFVIAQAEYDLFQQTVSATKKLFILGNGIDQTMFQPPTKTAVNETRGEMNFLFTGVMDYKPNVDAVLWFTENCWPLIKKAVPQATLTIAGMNPSPKIIELTNDKSIIVTGFVENILSYFHKADIFIAPFQIARGVQNKILQAMACRLPVISTVLGAEGIDYENNVNMITVGSELEFIEACVTLSNDPTKRRELGDNALTTIRNDYSWNSVLAPLKRIIDGRGTDIES